MLCKGRVLVFLSFRDADLYMIYDSHVDQIFGQYYEFFLSFLFSQKFHQQYRVPMLSSKGELPMEPSLNLNIESTYIFLDLHILNS